MPKAGVWRRSALLAVIVSLGAGALVGIEPPSAGALVSQDLSTALIFPLAGTEGAGPATAIAQAAYGLSVRGAELLVADGNSGAVRSVDLVSGVELTVSPADLGHRSAPSPLGMADAGGTYLVADGAAHTVSRVDVLGRRTIIAGTGAFGTAGDGGQAVNAQLEEPVSVATDAAGDVFIGDIAAHLVRKVSSSGVITTVAGNGEELGPDFPVDGDGGLATAATVGLPEALVVDSTGHLLIADEVGVRVRRINDDGTIMSVAGATSTGPPSACQGGPGTSIRLGSVSSMTVLGDGTVAIAGAFGCLLALDAAGNLHVLPTVVSPDVPSFASAYITGMASAPDGSLYLSDAGDGLVLRRAADGHLSLVAGIHEYSDALGLPHPLLHPSFASPPDGRPALDTQLDTPTGLVAAPNGAFIVVADGAAHQVSAIAFDGAAAPVTRVAGNGAGGFGGDGGPASQAWLSDPTAMAFGPDGSLYVVDSFQQQVRRIAPTGIISTVPGSGPSPPRFPTGIAVDGAGNIFLAECFSQDIREIRPDGTSTVLGASELTKAAAGDLNNPCPTGVAIGPNGSLYVTDTDRLVRLNTDGTASTLDSLTPPSHGDAMLGGFPSTGLPLGQPDVVAAPDGTVYFSDPFAHQVKRLATDGALTVIAGSGQQGSDGDFGLAHSARLDIPGRLALLPGGGLLVADPGAQRIRQIGIGLPGILPLQRLSGPNRIDTAVEISRATYPAGAAASVVIARADLFPDALAGSTLAARLGGPLLLTPSAGLDAWTESEIRRTLPPGGAVYLLGGTSALTQAVADRLTTLGYRIARLGGADRYATAALIGGALGQPDKVFLATGLDFPDGLCAAPAATGRGVILLTQGEIMAPATQAYLLQHPATPVVAVGGPASRADPAAAPIAGSDRYDTCARVAQQYFPTAHVVAVASGAAFPDALSGGASIGHANGPLLLSEPGQLTATTATYLHAQRTNLNGGYLYGGTSAVTATVEQQLVGATQ